MPVLHFPDPRFAGPEGLVAVGGDLHPKSLILAYSQGIFPWPIEGEPMLWFCPPKRGVLFFEELHVPKSLARAQRRSTLRFTKNQAFGQVIRSCALTKRPDQDGTWILPEMVEAYEQLHHLGHAHSLEAWEGEELVGGIYGVEVDGVFSGESMFHRAPNASKLALLQLVEQLKSRGLEWMDIQMLTPHMELLGARLISRNKYLDLLKRTRDPTRKLF